jgi:hypothetical protein
MSRIDELKRMSRLNQEISRVRAEIDERLRNLSYPEEKGAIALIDDLRRHLHHLEKTKLEVEERPVYMIKRLEHVEVSTYVGTSFEIAMPGGHHLRVHGSEDVGPNEVVFKFDSWQDLKNADVGLKLHDVSRFLDPVSPVIDQIISLYKKLPKSASDADLHPKVLESLQKGSNISGISQYMQWQDRGYLSRMEKMSKDEISEDETTVFLKELDLIK